jgi:hypothetical protein
MTPKQFASLAAVAAVSLLAAIVVYGSRANWTGETGNAGRLFPDLQVDAARVTRIAITQGEKNLSIEKSGDQWLLTSNDGYPAAADKVRALLVALTEADLLEPKTQRPDRFALLEVDDPTAKNSNARLIKLEDTSGTAAAEIIAGKRRLGQDGAAPGEGTYVRKPGENQSWLASTTIAGGAALRDWAAPRIFETDGAKVARLTVEVQGEQPYAIKRTADGSHELEDIPAGKKIKYVNMIDNIVEAAAFLDLERVRKAAAPSGEAGSVNFQTDDGLSIGFKIRRDKDGAWATIEATGEGDANKAADEITTRAKGWEFEVMPSKVETMLKKRDDLLEDAPS